MDGSYARSGKLPPVRMAVGALGREKDGPPVLLKVCPGLGDAGRDDRDGKRLTPGLGEDGRPTRGVDDESDTADRGSASVVAVDMLR